VPKSLRPCPVSIAPSKIPYGGFSLSTAPRSAYQTAPSRSTFRLSLLPAFPSSESVCIRPSCSPWWQTYCALCHRPPLGRAPPFGSPMDPTPGALASVRVIVSRSINTYSAPSAPLASTSPFRRTTVYRRCPHCAGAPQRPASGSALSLLTPSQHVVPNVPGELIATLPVLSRRPWRSPSCNRLRTLNVSAFGAY
jgi:hypothetical protein